MGTPAYGVVKTTCDLMIGTFDLYMYINRQLIITFTLLPQSPPTVSEQCLWSGGLEWKQLMRSGSSC